MCVQADTYQTCHSLCVYNIKMCNNIKTGTLPVLLISALSQHCENVQWHLQIPMVINKGMI